MIENDVYNITVYNRSETKTSFIAVLQTT